MLRLVSVLICSFCRTTSASDPQDHNHRATSAASAILLSGWLFKCPGVHHRHHPHYYYARPTWSEGYKGRKEATTTGVMDDEAKPRETTLSLFAVATWKGKKCIGKVISFHFRSGVGICWLTDKKSKANIYCCYIARRRQPATNATIKPGLISGKGTDSTWRHMTMVTMLVVHKSELKQFCI